MFGICKLSVIPLRSDASDRSELVSQVLFGEHFEILETTEKWSKIQLFADEYIGWIDTKQIFYITIKQYNDLSKPQITLSTSIGLIYNKNISMNILAGSNLNFLKHSKLNPEKYKFKGNKIVSTLSKNSILESAKLFLNTPYLWGGRTEFGIDCSGFTQLVYKLNGFQLFRDASQQVNQGVALSFIEESEPGDLAFFENEEGNIIHVGIIMKDNYIIHASGQVRIDRIDHLGIYNVDTKKHTHQLRVIKKII